MDKGCHNCVYLGRPSYDYPCYICHTKNGSAPSKWEGLIPATAEMVEVVRCKDCKHWNVHPINGRMTLGKCAKLSRVMADDWFCCFGERRTDGRI